MTESNKTLEDIIRQHVHLPHMNAKGWYPCVHLICDHGNKGERAAFLFDKDVSVFHCYNCGVKTKYDPIAHKSMPHKMQKILEDFGIDESYWQQIVFDNLALQPGNVTTIRKKVKSIDPMIIPTPEEFYFLKDALVNDAWANVAKTYLKEERGIEWAQYPFMMARKSDNMMMRKWLKRLIIPMYKNSNLVFYQGRDISGSALKKYQSPSTDAAKVLYGFDNLHNYKVNEPLYVVEGWFDAFLLDGCALLGNSISEEQEIHLNRCPRQKIFIPDRFGDGKEVAKHALSLGWSIATPDIGSDPTCKDITDIINKYGKLYTMKTLADRTATGFAAEIQLELYCKT